jgi:hypothetical protein
MAYWWLSSLKMTVGVETDKNSKIVNTAPITHKFIGQPLANLESWMKRQGGFRKEQLEDK